VEKGSVLIAPGDRHMRLVKRGSIYSVECFEGDKVNGHIPSVDVLFDSVTKMRGRKRGRDNSYRHGKGRSKRLA
jgi:two-component system chemotaxis response regulator CheB